MTVPATPYKVTYVATGTQSVYPYTFRIFLATDLVVQKIDTTGNVAPLTLSTDYTVDGLQSYTGGNVTLAAGNLTAGWSLVIFRDPALQQLTNIQENGPFSATAVLNALDLLTMQVQATRDRTSRSPHVPISESPSDAAITYPPIAIRANKFSAFDASGNFVVASAVTTSGIPDASIVQVVDSIAALKALSIPSSAVTYIVRGYYAAGDGGGGTFRWNSADATADNGGTTIQLNAGGAGRWNRIFSGGIEGVGFGIKADGVSDDTAAFISALAAVSALTKSKKLILPAGTMIITSSLINGIPCIEGLQIIGGGIGGFDTARVTVIQYSGAAPLFYFLEPNGTAQKGGMVFEKFSVNITNAVGKFLQLNDTSLTQFTDTAATPNYITGVKIIGVSLYGPGAGTSTVAAISGIGAFHLVIDDDCYITGFRRGVWLKQCDNCTISCRAYLNTRNVMIERNLVPVSGYFGNDNCINARWLGTPTAGGEPAYVFYDNGRRTKLIGVQLEDATSVGVATAFIDCERGSYLNIDLNQNGIPVFEIGANCFDTNIYSAKASGSVTAPIVNQAATYDEANVTGFKGISLHGASKVVLNACASSARVRIEGRTPEIATAGWSDDITVSANGIRGAASRRDITPALFSGQSTGTGFSAIAGIFSDSASPTGGYIRLPATNLAGFKQDMWTVGRNVNNLDYIRLDVIARQSGALTGDFRVILYKNGVQLSNTPLTASTVYALTNVTTQITGSVVGDTISVGIYNNAEATRTLDIASCRACVTSAPSADTSGATLAALEIEVNKLKAIFRNLGQLG